MKNRKLAKSVFVLFLCFAVIFSCSVALVTPAQAYSTPADKNTVRVSATLAYTLKLNWDYHVIAFHIGRDYIYVTQHNGATTYLSRLTINGATASYKDHMTLQNCGIGETLDMYNYNGKTYFLVGCRSDNLDHSDGKTSPSGYYAATQIARIQYEPNKTYTYTNFRRFGALDQAGSTSSKNNDDGTVFRVAAAVCGEKTIFRIRCTTSDGKYRVRFAAYDTQKLNAALDSNSAKRLDMNTATAIAAKIRSFNQMENSSEGLVHPNTSFKGMELSCYRSVYIAGGATKDTNPQIARMDMSTQESNKKKNDDYLIILKDFTNTEIYGLQAECGRLYFHPITGSNKKTDQKIYYISESVLPGSCYTTSDGSKPRSHEIRYKESSQSPWNCKAAWTCTSAGFTPYAYCIYCGYQQSTQEYYSTARGHDEIPLPAVAATCTTYGKTAGSYCTRCSTMLTAQTPIAPTGHSYNGGVLTQEATCTQKGITTYTCATCGDTHTKESEKLLHIDENEDGICDRTACQSSTDATPQTLLLDYGKAIESNIVEKAIINGIPEEHLRNAELVNVSLLDEADASSVDISLYDADSDGKADSLRLAPSAILNKVIRLNCTLRISASGGDVCQRIIPVTVVPATAVYYETDFTEGVFDLTTTGSSWTKISDSSSNDQDNGDCDDPLTDLTYDKQKYPANSFFADFNGDTQRYMTDPIYAGMDFNLVENWTVNDPDQKVPVIDTVKGTATFTLDNNTGEQLYFQSSKNITSGFSLNYHPEQDHWVVARFKLEHMIRPDSNSHAKLRLDYDISSDYAEGNDIEQYDLRYTAGSHDISDDAFTTGEYVTVKFPLADLSPDHTRITLLRFVFANVQSESATVMGSAIIDYLYVGPLEEEGSASTIDPDYYEAPTYSATQYLLFDFDNSENAKARYSNSNYQNRTNYDTSAHWCYIANNNGAVENLTTSGTKGTVDNVKGTLTVPIGKQQSSHGRYGTYVGPTDGTNQVINFQDITGHTFRQSLNFTPASGAKTYFHIRFKFNGCKKDELLSIDEKAFIQISLLRDKSTAYHIDQVATYVFENGKYIELSLDISSQANSCATIRSFYLRFSNIVRSGSSDGSVEIDYIYIGPESDPNKIRSAKESNIFIDFDNENYDKNRYAGELYGGVNYDAEGAWTNNTWFTHTISNGIMTLKPTQDAINDPDGWGRKDMNSDFAPLSYKTTGADYIVARIKVTGVTPLRTENTPFFACDIGTMDNGGTRGTHDYTTSEPEYLDLINDDGKWVTCMIDISTLAKRYDTITFIRPYFKYMKFTAESCIEIDYIYIGSRKNGSAPAQALYFGFGNRLKDQERYDSVTYNGLNFDEEKNWHNRENISSVSMDNDEGILEIKPDAGATYLALDSSDASASFPLNFHPQDVEIFQIRFKMEGFSEHSAGDPFLRFQYFYDDVTSASTTGDHCFSAEHLTDGEYITMTLDLREDSIREVAQITRVRCLFGHFNSGADSKVTIDYLYLGPGEVAENLEMTYGYDSTYQNDGNYSNGSSLFVEGAGVLMMKSKTDINGNEILDENGNPIKMIDYDSAKNYTEASFTFTGTGFDIISRTGKQQGALRVVVCDTLGNVQKTVSILNKGETKLFQIPVVSITDLPHGTYTVHIFVNAPITNAPLPELLRGGEFYFDAVRIYNTINTEDVHEDSAYAYKVYQDHGEADPTFRELRDILIDASKDTPEAAMDGVVYLDISGNTSTSTIAKYESVGPKNEVYLSPGNAVAFKLEVKSRIPASIDIGVKSADGATVSMTTGIGAIVSDAKSGGSTRSITTATTQYYPLEIPSSLWQASGDTSYIYVMISNTGTEGILSVTHIKYAYDVPQTHPTMESRSVRFTVSPTMLEQLLVPCEHKWDEGTVIDAPTCVSTGKVRYACQLCEETLTEELSVLGHIYIYTPANTDYHNVTCSNCDHFATVPHMYTAKECICGQPAPRDPVEEPGWKIAHTLNLASDISVSLVIQTSALAGFHMDTVYIESALDVYEGNTKIGENSVRLYPVENGDYYYFTLTGLTAVQMNNSITSVLHGTKDGQEYYSPVDEYSVATYAYSQLNKASAPSALKGLCADLLRYGAMAQVFKEYRTDALADSAMTDEHRAYLSHIDAVEFGNTNTVLKDLAEPSVSWVGKALNLDSKVELKFVFAPENYTGDLADLTLQVAYTDVNGDPETARVENWEVYDEERGYYAFTLDTLLAAELRTVVSAQIYAGNTPVSCTLQYTADTYGNNKTGALGDLCKALFAYSDSAKAYFNS